MKPSIYVSPKEHRQHRSLRNARREFTQLAVKPEPVALVRENGLYYEVTFSHNSDMVHKTYGNFKQVQAFLDHKFPGNTTLSLR